MVGLFIGLAVIAAGAATVYFIASSLGPQLFREKNCVRHPQECESPTTYNAPDRAPRYLLCDSRNQSPTESMARRCQLRGPVTGGRMFRPENGATT